MNIACVVFFLVLQSVPFPANQLLGSVYLSNDTEPHLTLDSPGNIVLTCKGNFDTRGCPFRQDDISQGLILHYTFDNASNLAQDSTRNGYHGTIIGNVTQSQGVVGGGAYFSGTYFSQKKHHYIEIPNVVNRAGYTVALWGKLSSPGNHNSLFMLHGGNPFTNTKGETRYDWTTSNLWIFTSHGKLAVIQQQVDLRYNDFPLPLSSTYPNLVPRMASSPLLATSTWHHIAVSYSDGRLSAYIDGQLVYEFINVEWVPKFL
jgi:hypothetical protein